MTQTVASTRVLSLDPGWDRLRVARSAVRGRLNPLLSSVELRIAGWPPLPAALQPVFFLSVATVVIALALTLLRSGPLPTVDTDSRYLAAARVDMSAFALPAAPPSAAPASPAVRPAAPVVSISLPASPMDRVEGIKVVLATARSLIGRPYRYGATGPEAFDCSGFTSFVWRAAGVSLPHNSGAQYASLPRVSLSDLQPGDLVFSGPGRIGHVGLYVGGGMMIDAPETGRSVEIEALRGNLIGAARPALLLRGRPVQAQAQSS